MRIPISVLIGASALSLSASATAQPYGGPYLGSAFSPYDSLSCAVDDLNGDYYNGYPLPGCGWYNDYFYPGFGRIMYDRNHGQHVWDGGAGSPRPNTVSSTGFGGGMSGFGGGMRGIGGGGFSGGGGGHGGGGHH